MRLVARLLLGAALVFAGVSHLTFAREAFQAQVPTWLPFDPDFVVVASGVVEIILGSALLVVPFVRPAWTGPLGWVVAAFFVAIFPGNISQYVTGTDSFGLNDDTTRFVRLLFQPVLVIWAIWCTRAWGWWRGFRASRSDAGRSSDPDGGRPGS